MLRINPLNVFLHGIWTLNDVRGPSLNRLSLHVLQGI